MPPEGISQAELGSMLWKHLKSALIKIAIILGIYITLCFLLTPYVESLPIYQTDPELAPQLIFVFPVLVIAYFFIKGTRRASQIDVEQAKWRSTATPSEIRGKIEQPKISQGKGLFIVLSATTFIGMIAMAIGIIPAMLSAGKSIHDIPWMIFGLPFGILYAVFGLAYLSNSSRRSSMEHFATNAGFEYTGTPLNTDGFDITLGSVIAHGQGDNGYANLIHGTRNHFSFRSIDYFYPHGKGADVQTIICIDLKNLDLTPFSIIKNDYTLLDHAQKIHKTPSEKYANNITKSYVVMVNEHRTTELKIPIGILNAFSIDAFASNQSLNIEYMGDRLLIYRFCHKLTKNNFLQALDEAILLAQKLG
jgi:hypothetical protein